MDIDLLSKMVKELILDNDRVVLPGLGCFVAEIVPSTFADKGYTINPPYRRLYFRSRPDQGEELARFYAESNKVELAVADKIVKDFVAELKSVLHVKKTVIFPGLGRLRATKENTVFFVADEDLDIYPDGFGLEPISLKTHQESREDVAAAVVGLRSILEEPAGSESVSEEAAAIAVDKVVDVVDAAVDEIPEAVEVSDDGVEEALQAVEIEEVVEVVETAEAIVEIVEIVPETVGTEEEASETPSEEQNVTSSEGQEEIVEDIVVASPVKKSFWKTLGKVFLWVCVAAVALLAIYVAVSRLCPGILDSVLYTPEELQIIKDL